MKLLLLLSGMLVLSGCEQHETDLQRCEELIKMGATNACTSILMVQNHHGTASMFSWYGRRPMCYMDVEAARWGPCIPIPEGLQ